MIMAVLESFLVVFFFLILVYIYLKWTYGYWKRRGLEYLEPAFFYGNTPRDLSRSMGDQFAKLYLEMKKKGYRHGGAFAFFKPIYIPVDLDLIRNILSKDFDHFVNHGTYYHEEVDPLTGHIFSLEDEKWRKLRAKVTPTFTSGKIKMMFQTILECSSGLSDLLKSHAAIQDAVDIKEILSRFTTDVIGSVVFGLDFDSIKNPDSKFRENGRKLSDLKIEQRCRHLVTFIFPNHFLRSIGFRLLDKEMSEFFLNVVRNTIIYRETNNIFRKDFMHLMLQLKNRGKVTDDKFITKQEGEAVGPDFITENELAAQCFLFFIAGFDTSATTMTFLLFEIAMNKDIQDKLRTEIRSVLKKHDGNLTYDAIKEMHYLDLVVYETLRKHPPFPVLPRICTKPYQVPDTNVVIEKGTNVVIPLLAIQRDPENYYDPDKFIPERFTEENKAKRHPFAFLSFGEGPRYCLGSRFGLLQTKIGVISILNNYKVDLHEKMQLPIKYITKFFILAVEGDVWLKLSKID